MRYYPYVYVLGIGGSGMSAIARWFATKGTQVFGHDIASSTLTDQLFQEGIHIHFEASEKDIPLPVLKNKQDSLVVYTPSISVKNPIWQYLVSNGYTLCKRGDVLSMLTESYYTLAIAGTHGKTTSTSLAAHIFYYAEKNITAFLGGISKNYHTNFITNNNTRPDPTIVIEADEFDRFFLKLHPNIAIVTTVDPDHLDTYGDINNFEKGFRQFLDKLPQEGLAILHQNVAEKLLNNSYSFQAQVITYALQNASICTANLYIDASGHFCFDYISEKITIKDIRLKVPGYHNVENALAVITACLHRDIAPEIIREAINTFQGTDRRFDIILQNNDIIFLDDYGHHPVEITVLINTIRKLYPAKNISIIFRPNQYSRTKDFLTETAESLSLADRIFILDIYSDREDPIEGISSQTILDKMSLNCKYLCNKDNLIGYLQQAGKLEVIVNLGAGDAEDFIQPVKEFLLKNYC